MDLLKTGCEIDVTSGRGVRGTGNRRYLQFEMLGMLYDKIDVACDGVGVRYYVGGMARIVPSQNRNMDAPCDCLAWLTRQGSGPWPQCLANLKLSAFYAVSSLCYSSGGMSPVCNDKSLELLQFFDLIKLRSPRVLIQSCTPRTLC